MSETLKRDAQDTLTPVEMNCGDTLKFKLCNGQIRTLVLEDTGAEILERVDPGGTTYQFMCRILINGQPMTLRRYVCTQECFYEPYVINGMRIWFDAVADIFDLIPMREMETQRIPHKHARFAVQDATLSICPQKMKPWYPNEKNFIDVGDCYNGDDCWLGPYLGQACHGGLDINHAKGDPLWAPIDFDDQWLFNSLAAGHNNNRWRGVRKWPNGDTWVLQVSHLIKLLVHEHEPIKAGTPFAIAAGVNLGSHEHSHFLFSIVPKASGTEIHLDPWIIFREIFETRKASRGEIHAAMLPLGPAQTGQEVSLRTRGCRRGLGGEALSFYWTFGDGGWSNQAHPKHTFSRPGIYPVTLIVDDGVRLASCTQHMTVIGDQLRSPALSLVAPDEPLFRERPVEAMDVYGRPVKFIPHTLEFLARPTRPRPRARIVVLKNLGGGTLPDTARPTITYLHGAGWLSVEPEGTGNEQSLKVRVNATGFKPGSYQALVHVDSAGAINSPQSFRVGMYVPPYEPIAETTIDDKSPEFYCTPYFWVGHRFCRCQERGFGQFYLTNGGRAKAGEFARFTPELQAGTYEISLSDKTPFTGGAEFNIRVCHKSGEEIVRVNPEKSRTIGTFDFEEGIDGFVEILADGSRGVVVADAIVFRRVEPGR